MKEARRVLWLLALTVAACALVGGVYGQHARAEADAGSANSEAVGNGLDTFAKVYSVVEANYAEALSPDRAILGAGGTGLGAIPGMLSTLDPHSNFLDAKTFARFTETQEGKYYGVGMRILTVPGKMGKWMTTVVEPMTGSPALRAGLRPGDIIQKVDGKPVEGLDGDTVAKMLKGPRGTVVHVTVGREGYDQPLEFSLRRAEITGMSVDDYFFIRPGIAYIRIATFSETTGDELNASLGKLGEKNIKGLVLDLRGNPGGILQAAVDVADQFLAKHQLIVYHNGRHSSEERYYARSGDHGDDYPVVVLINHGTASAAEIVTGALQDHDRALVMGVTSFGKGLVQKVYTLSEGTGLLLTTAHYYTPSGRLIQRNYDNISLYDYLYAPETVPPPHTEVHHTDGGREVFGGGGITPDVKVDEPAYSVAESRLLASASCPDFLQCGPFFEFAKYYLGTHKTVPRDFVPDDSAVDEFRDFLSKQGLMLSDKDMQGDREFIKNHLRDVLVGMVYGQDEARHLSVTDDFVVEKAIAALPEAAALVTHARKYMASHAALRPSF
ncbi:MAG TPA: S41 family peptidase [Terriglobia bacterium]|nr:S41 family peptidase [Terriglobia bacterium]